MNNIRFQSALRHVNDAGAWIAHKMDWAFRCGSHILTCRGQREVFYPGLFRRVILIPNGLVQTGLETAEQSLHAANRNENPRGPPVELDCPFSIVVYVETRDTLDPVSKLRQLPCQYAAEFRGRGALETKLVDLSVCQPPLAAQMFPMGWRQGQSGHHSSKGAVYFLLAGTFRLGHLFIRPSRTGSAVRRGSAPGLQGIADLLVGI